MINLNKYKNYQHTLDEFFLYIDNYSIIERFGVWGTTDCDDDPQRTRHIIYHNLGVDEDGSVDSCEEGIEILWNYNVLNIKIEDDYYKIIK